MIFTKNLNYYVSGFSQFLNSEVVVAKFRYSKNAISLAKALAKSGINNVKVIHKKKNKIIKEYNEA